MKEIFDRPYIAIPIKESPLLSLLRTLNKGSHFFHMTLVFLGTLDETEFISVKDFLQNDTNFLNGISLDPTGIELFGVKQKTQVLRLKPIEVAENFRASFDQTFPNYGSFNLPFIPHVTIKKYDNIAMPPVNHNLSKIEPYKARSIGIYYRTEEGATALLYSKKI